MNKFLINIKEIVNEGPIGIYLMAFLIPLYEKWLGFAVLIIILEQIIRRTPIKKENIKAQLTWRNPGVWLFLFYFMHVVGLIHTENMAFAGMDLGMKSTLAIFPLFFILYQPVVKWRVFVRSFVLGAFVSIVVNFFLALDLLLEMKNIYYLTGSYLSKLMHRGYWATYLLLAYFFLLKTAVSSQSIKKLIVNLAGALFIAFFVVLSESRLGYIAMAVISIWAMIKIIKILRNKWIIPLIAGLFVGSIFLIYNYMPGAVKRVTVTVESLFKPTDSLSQESLVATSSRLYVWESSVELIQENFWFGVGTGDIKDELIQRNLDKGYTELVELKLNSHNQFLNSHIALGVFGSLFLLFAIVTSFVKQKNDPIRFWRVGVVFILFLAMLPESMLEVQAGIIPYAFLLTFLTACKLKQEQKDYHVSQY